MYISKLQNVIVKISYLKNCSREQMHWLIRGLKNVFVQNIKGISPNCKMYLFKFQVSKTAAESKCIDWSQAAQSSKIYFFFSSKLLNIFVWIAKCICSSFKNSIKEQMHWLIRGGAKWLKKCLKQRSLLQASKDKNVRTLGEQVECSPKLI